MFQGYCEACRRFRHVCELRQVSLGLLGLGKMQSMNESTPSLGALDFLSRWCFT